MNFPNIPKREEIDTFDIKHVHQSSSSSQIHIKLIIISIYILLKLKCHQNEEAYSDLSQRKNPAAGGIWSGRNLENVKRGSPGRGNLRYRGALLFEMHELQPVS